VGVDLTNCGQGLESVHLRHVEIEDHDVGLELRKLIERNTPICGGAYDLELRVGVQNIR
jgi:hypothetical protein